MAAPTESPKRGYPIPDAGRLLRPDRTPRFAFNVPPSSPSFHYHGHPVTYPPMFRNALLQENRRRHFQNTNNSTTIAADSTAATCSLDKVQICLISAIIFFSIVTLIGIPMIMFYAFGPHSPTISVEQLSLHYPVFYTSATRFSSLLNITLKLNNPAKHIGVFYESDNSIVASYAGFRLCSGGIPPFFQAPKDEMLVKSPLTGLGVQLPDDVLRRLEKDHKHQRVPLSLNMMGMARFKMGSVTSRALLKVSCDIIVDSMHVYSPRIISSTCHSAAGFWVAAITT